MQNSVTEVYENVIESNEVVGEYEVHINGLDKKLKIKVIKTESGMFMGLANLEVKGSAQAGYYRSLHLQKTKESAFRDALSGFLAFYSEQAQIREVEDW